MNAGRWGRLMVLVLLGLATPRSHAEITTITVFDGVVLHFTEGRTAPELDGILVRRGEGLIVDRTLDLPPLPPDMRDARRITALIDVRPITTAGVPNDPWTRLGWLSLVEPPPAPGADPLETELVRFVTPFGGPASFEQDLTALAPLLAGRRTLSIYLATYSDDPGWRVTVRLRYDPEGVGQRRPVYAQRVDFEPHVTAKVPFVEAIVTIPRGVDTPRIRVLTSGHATDGQARHEFVTAPHVIRVDGIEIARWRPWLEDGGRLRALNPRAGRSEQGGRVLRSSDFDRSGWQPGLVVEPTWIPVPELTPGPHRIRVEITGIRPEDPLTSDGKRHHGYWAVSVIVVADEPWPAP